MTIKELADTMGVSKTAIRKRLTEDFRARYTKIGASGAIEISEIGCKLIAETLQTASANQPKITGNQPQTGRKPPETAANQPETDQEPSMAAGGGRVIEPEILEVDPASISIQVPYEVYCTLQEQLKVKDQQIEQLQSALVEAQKTAAATAESLKAAQALHAGSLKVLGDGDLQQRDADVSEQRSHWWQFWR